MIDDRHELDPELEELRQSYRDLKAPAHTAARVVAAADPQPRPRGSLRLAYAGAALVVGALVLLPFITVRESGTDTVSMLPSLNAVSRAMPSKRALPTPSLTGIRSVTLPAMPKRPALNQPQDTQSFYSKEEHHDFV